VDGEPCNKCASCQGIENGSILDVLEIDAASNNGVDNVRALRDEAIYTPASVLRRVYIVDEVHMLSPAAFNALLKILEEPPEHLIFILATTELHKVPATILSRCQRFSFKRLSPAVIADRLNVIAGQEGIDLSTEAAEKLASLADGSMRDGISLLDQCAAGCVVDLKRVLDTIGLAGQQELLRLAAAATERNIPVALEVFDALYNDGKDIAALLSELAGLSRDLLMYKLATDTPGNAGTSGNADTPLLSGNFSRAELSALSKKLTPERLFLFLDIVREAIAGLSRGGSVRLQAEMCIIRMCDERLGGDAVSLLARVAKLENSEAGFRSSGVSCDITKSENQNLAFEHENKADSPGEPAEPVIEPVQTDNMAVGAPPDSSGNSVTNSETGEPSGISELNEPVDVQEPGEPSGISKLNEPVVVPEPGEPSGISELNEPVDVPEPGEPSGISELNEPVDVPEPGEPSGISELNEPVVVPESDFWQQILELLQSDPAVHAVLSDGDKIQAEQQEGLLILRSDNLFTADQIKKEMTSVPLKEAASKVLGREIVIRVETGSGSGDPKRDKIESLKAHGNVNFE